MFSVINETKIRLFGQLEPRRREMAGSPMKNGTHDCCALVGWTPRREQGNEKPGMVHMEDSIVLIYINTEPNVRLSSSSMAANMLVAKQQISITSSSLTDSSCFACVCCDQELTKRIYVLPRLTATRRL